MLPERTVCVTSINNYISDTPPTEKQVYGGVLVRNLQTNSIYHLNKHMNGKIPTPTGRLVGSDLLARRSGGSEATDV